MQPAGSQHIVPYSKGFPYSGGESGHRYTDLGTDKNLANREKIATVSLPSLSYGYSAPKHAVSLFPDSLKKLKVGEGVNIGGIPGGMHRVDEDGNHYTLKTIEAKPDDRNYWEHLLSEYYAIKIYKFLEILVPEVQLYDLESGQKITEDIVKVGASKFKNLGLLFKNIHGNSIKLSEYLADDKDGSRYHEVQKIIQKDFVADCLIGNDESVGNHFENMLINLNTKQIWRMNCSGTLGYTTKGLIGRFRTNEIEGLKTMRDKKNPAAIFFKTITNKEFQNQVESILNVVDKLKVNLPRNFHMLFQSMDHRTDVLKKIAGFAPNNDRIKNWEPSDFVLPELEGLNEIDYDAWRATKTLIEKRRFLSDIFTQENISDGDIRKFIKHFNLQTDKEIFYNDSQATKSNWLVELLKTNRLEVFHAFEHDLL